MVFSFLAMSFDLQSMARLFTLRMGFPFLFRYDGWHGVMVYCPTMDELRCSLERHQIAYQIESR